MELIKLTQAELDEKLRKHRLWLENAEGGERLCGAYDLSTADLSSANLSSANLRYANRFNECTHGIHFFVDRGEAERW